MKFALPTFFEDFISMIYPRYCRACKNGLVKGEEIVCTHCLLSMPRTHFVKDKQNALYTKLALLTPIQYAFAYYHFKKGSKVQELMHEFKYKNQPEIGVKLGKVMGYELILHGYSSEFDCIVPVPLHASRVRQRGYNQSEEFAMGLSAVLNIPVSRGFVKRSVKTETQTKKSKLNRWNNVHTVFEVTSSEEISGKRVLLVDDVVTTGATLEACAAVLQRAGCTQLSVGCIAMA